MLHRSIAFILALLVTVACGEDATSDKPLAAPEATQEAIAAVPWIVAAAHPLAVEAGADILREGGSAVDAAVAVQAVLGLVEPQSSGLAGGAFMLFYDASTQDIIAYDGREQAAETVTPEVFLQDDGSPMGFFEAVLSGKAVGVPGVVAMLDMAHREHGQLAWGELFGGAETLASEGFPMPQRLNALLGRFRDFRDDPQAAIYLAADGTVLPLGATVTNPPYAETVRQLADEGAASFYSGDVAKAIIARVNAKTGEPTLSLDDFAAYTPLQREPVCAMISARTVCSMPPPSSGGITLLQIMQMFLSVAGPVSPDENLLAYIEASRLAYADRGRFLGDPTAMGTDEFSVDDLIDVLVSGPYLQGRAALIGSVPAEGVSPGNPSGDGAIREGRIDGDAYEVPSTSHFSIRDRRGNVVALTSSVEMPFGSQMMAGGMVLNNQLTDFARAPSEDGVLATNAPGPGKRPMSSMTPVIVLNDNNEPIVAIGSPGGPAIIGYVAKPLLTHLATGAPLSEAIREPHVVTPRGSLIIEEGDTVLTGRAEALGYEVKTRALTSGLYGFAIDAEGEVDLVADPRREGTAEMERP